MEIIGGCANLRGVTLYIYTITTFKDFNKYGIPSNSRCVGYFTNFKDADEIVRNNLGDIYEFLYNYIVIEKVKEGLYPTCLERQFYKVCIDVDKHDKITNVIYKPIDDPECVKHIVNFVIG